MTRLKRLTSGIFFVTFGIIKDMMIDTMRLVKIGSLRATKGTIFTGRPPVIRTPQTVIRLGNLVNEFSPLALLTFRVAAVSAAIAARRVLKLPAALGALADQTAHFRLRLDRRLYHLTLRFRQSF